MHSYVRIVLSRSVFGGYLNKIHERPPYFISESVLYLLILSGGREVLKYVPAWEFPIFQLHLCGSSSVLELKR